MRAVIDSTDSVTTVPDGVGDAVGVEKSHWYVAIVNHNTEKASAEKLDKLGIDNYVATQTELRIWKNGRKAKINRVVIPSTIFIFCTEQKRKEIVCLPFINRFMSNKAGTSVNTNTKPLAIIPGDQIRRLRFMLGQSDIPVTISDRPYRVGDRVRVLRGSLMGLEGEVVNLKSAKSELVVSLDFFGCAKLSIDTVNLEIIP